MDEIKAQFTEEEQELWSRAIAVELKALEKHAMRVMVVETGERVDGRVANEIRPIMVKPDVPATCSRFWSFQRGQTQVLSIVHLACSTSAAS